MAEKQYHNFISKITKTSPYGFQLAETGEDVWINYGKFYEGNKEFEAGQEISVSCTESNGKYYVNKIDGSTGKASSQAIQELVNDANQLEVQRDARQVAIVRQSSLKAAVDYATADAQVVSLTPEKILEVAEQFEKWVLR
jgi:cold shock CspA family protein|tara:strand:- start:199 stop:618 length:420 start_codon:yes stop_codon:yes gene_type:complete